MTNLIPFSNRKIGGVTTASVSARELHQFLQSKQDFSNWIKSRVKKWRFIEEQDFSIILSRSANNRSCHEYYLSLDMAKMLSMSENSTVGDQARRYFLDCEQQLIKQLKLKALPDQSLDDLVANSPNPNDFQAVLYRSHQSSTGVRVVMSIRKGKPLDISELKPTDTVVDVADLKPIFDSVAVLQKKEPVQLAEYCFDLHAGED